MNYELSEIPYTSDNPVIYMDIGLSDNLMGRIHITLFRDVFPAGVENFVHIAKGDTYRTIKQGVGEYTFYKQIRRTYDGCLFFEKKHDNYVISGDIYKNTGESSGTIYCDNPIPPQLGKYFYDNDKIGLVSLVPFTDEESGEKYYDSVFMITLQDASSTNLLKHIDSDHIVIGTITNGIEIIKKMNDMIVPFAGRKQPEFRIIKSGLYRTNATTKTRKIN